MGYPAAAGLGRLPWWGAGFTPSRVVWAVRGGLIPAGKARGVPYAQRPSGVLPVEHVDRLDSVPSWSHCRDPTPELRQCRTQSAGWQEDLSEAQPGN